MIELGFDIYAMVQPKNESDISALLDEALSELDILNTQLNNLLGSDKKEPS